jgi:hypothetical protein
LWPAVVAVLAIASSSPRGVRAASEPLSPRDSAIATEGLLVFIDVTGDNLIVELMDPKGRRDVWAGAPHRSPIPGCSRFTGRVSLDWPPTLGRVAAMTHIALTTPVAGPYMLRINSPVAASGRIEIRRPYEVDSCCAADTIAIRPGETRCWRLSWSPAHGADTCWVRLQQLGRCRGR